MKKLGVAIAIAGALMLAGCASAEPAGVETQAAPMQESTALPTPTPTATGPASTAEPDTGGFGLGDYTPDSFFLEIMNQYWQGERPGDQELFDAAGLACEQLRGGTPEDQVVVVESDQQNNKELLKAAIQVYCPEYR